MYMKSASTSGSYSLTFLGRKVGRNHSVAPAGKQIAWETSIRSPERVVPSHTGQVPVAVQVHENLPGSVPELKEERSRPIPHNTQLDQHGDNRPGGSGRKVTA